MSDLQDLCLEISRSAPAQGAIEYLGHTPFGRPHSETDGVLSIERFRLKNGLQVLLSVDRSAPVVAFQAWFRVGSRHEKPGKTGLCHLFEHLMFNEVEGLPAGEFDARMEAAGADNNASTWLDFTQYQESFPKQHLSMVLDLEARRMNQLVLRDPQVQSEKEVVKNERRYRVEDDVEGKVQELLYKTAFEKHPYHWPTIGWMQDIESFTTTDCLEFYKTYYAPNNASIILVGDLDVEGTLREICSTYGNLEPSEIPAETLVLEPPQAQERRVEIALPTPTEKLVLGYKCPAIADSDHAPLGLLVEVLTGGRASRLYRRLVRKDESASDVSGFVGPHVHPSLTEFSLSARPGNTCEELLRSFDEEISRLLAEPITFDELMRARNRTELGLIAGMETADGKASSMGFYETTLGMPAASFDRLRQMEAVTPDALLKIAQRYFDRSQRTLIFVRSKASQEEGH